MSMALSLRNLSWRPSLLSRLTWNPEIAPVVGRGVLPGGIRFVVVRTSRLWADNAEVEFLGGRATAHIVQPGLGWVSGRISQTLVRVTLGNGCDGRTCHWARLHVLMG